MEYTVVKYSETQFGPVLLIRIQCPPKKVSGRKYAKNILRTGG
jgi:hypothetical protein